MKKVAIVGLGWLGMPLALSLAAKGWHRAKPRGWGGGGADVRYRRLSAAPGAAAGL
jgi:prephenate dehydrogenase